MTIGGGWTGQPGPGGAPPSTGDVTVTLSEASATWVLTGLLGYNSGPQTGTQTLFGLDFDTYTATFDDNLLAFTSPSPDAGVLSGPSLALSGTYALRAAATINVDAKRDGSDVLPPITAGWSVEAVGFAAQFTAISAGDATPVVPTLGSIVQGRTYSITFTVETNYTTPTPPNILASATPQTFTGDYLTLVGTVFFADELQTTVTPGNFQEWIGESPIDVQPISNRQADGNDYDAADVSMARIANPITPFDGFVIKQGGSYNLFDGVRSQAGVWTINGEWPAMEAHVAAQGTLYISWEEYIPTQLQIPGAPTIQWFAIWDSHPQFSGGGWGGGWGLSLFAETETAAGKFFLGANNASALNGGYGISAYSDIALPIGQWFTMEIEYPFSQTSTRSGGAPGVPITVYVDGVKQLQETDLATYPPGTLDNLQWYFKAYGLSNAGDPYTPNPYTSYRRNHKITDTRQTFPTVLWQDNIQAGVDPWGFDEISREWPIDTPVAGSDATADATKVADPGGGGGSAIRMISNHNDAPGIGGARVQLGVWSFGTGNEAFEAHALSGAKTFYSYECYIPGPSRISAIGNTIPWLSFGDIHTVQDGGNRFDTQPGIFVVEAGTGQLKLEWHYAGMPDSADSDPAFLMPLDQWFSLEWEWSFTTSADSTFRLYLDGDLLIEQTGMRTADPGMNQVELYVKQYGDDQSGSGGNPWSPDPTIRYVRNVRISDGQLFP